MFTAELFAITKTWKQPNCAFTVEWIKKIIYIYIYTHNRILYIYIYIYIIVYYSAIKRKEVTAFAATWMDLEIMLSEISQTVRHQHHMLSPTCGI